MTGIYLIQSKSHPERCYVGSSVNVKRRLNHHKNCLINNTHHSVKLQNHVNKHGIDDLEFKPFAECDQSILIGCEQEFISFFKPWFNISPSAGSNYGYRHSEETKRKISESHKGIRPNDETRRLLSEQRRGNKFFLDHKHSDDAKQKNREKHIGRTWSEERRQRHSERMSGCNNPFYGRHHSVETKELLRNMQTTIKNISDGTT